MRPPPRPGDAGVLPPALLVSIAMSGKMKVNLYGIFTVQNGGPLKSAALFGRTPRTCLRPALACAVGKFPKMGGEGEGMGGEVDSDVQLEQGR